VASADRVLSFDLLVTCAVSEGGDVNDSSTWVARTWNRQPSTDHRVSHRTSSNPIHLYFRHKLI